MSGHLGFCNKLWVNVMITLILNPGLFWPVLIFSHYISDYNYVFTFSLKDMRELGVIAVAADGRDKWERFSVPLGDVRHKYEILYTYLCRNTTIH